MLAPRKASYDKPRQRIKKQKHHFGNKGPYSQNSSLSSSLVWDVRVGLEKKLSAELILLNWGVGEDS